jgi:glucose/arabinose dehydrogenase
MLRMSVVLLLVMMLAACSLSTEAQPTPMLAPQPAPTRSPLPTPARSPLPTPPRSPAPTSTSDERPPASVAIPPGAEASVRAAISDLAAKRRVAPEAVQVVSVEAVDWSDTSLGCPQPGMFYAQVIVQGYKIVLSAGGQQAEYHADRNGRVVTCGK